MKKIIYLFVLTTAFVFTSCSKDDDNNDSPDPITENQISHDGAAVDITSVEIEDFGAFEGYYNYDFYLDGTAEGIGYSFYAELFSPLNGGDSFTGGTFIFSTVTPTDPPAHYFTIASLEIGNVELDVIAGNIVVSGSGSNYSISGTLTLENDTTVVIDYSGEFTIIDE